MAINRRVLATPSFATVLIVGLLLWAKGERNQTFSGTVEWRFEVSAFHPNRDCTVPSYWLDIEVPAGGDLQKRWKELGRPEALRVTLTGDLSRVGRLGSFRCVHTRDSAP